MIQPIRNNVLVKPLGKQQQSTGGILVPESYQKDSNRVEVVAVGNGTKGNPMPLKPGMIGYRVQDWGTPIEENGTTYYLMEASAILCTD